MPDGGYCIAELAVDAATVVELLVGVTWRALVLDAADAADAHNEDDEHKDKGYTQSSDDDVKRVAGHVGQSVLSVCWLPLQVWDTHTQRQSPFCVSRFKLIATETFSDRLTYRSHSWGPPTQVDSDRWSHLIGRCRCHHGDKGCSRTHWCRPRTSPLSRQVRLHQLWPEQTCDNIRAFRYSYFMSHFYCITSLCVY